MADKMWFGHARGHMQYVPCPLIGSSVTRNRYVESIRFENGGGDGRRSNQYQMQYDFQFSDLAHKVDGIDAFNKFAQGFYGDDLIYLAHPAAFETNLFPAGWATPSLSEKGWGKISTDAVSYSDADGPSVTNLVTNPSMEASSGTVTVRTNLVTNPSMETVTSGSVVMRRNLATNTLTGANTTGLGAFRLSLATASGYVRGTITDAAAGYMAQRITGGNYAISGGVTYTLTVKGRTSAPIGLMASRIAFLDAGGSEISSAYSADGVVNGSTFTKLPTLTLTAPANAVNLTWQVGVAGNGGKSIGDTVDVSELLIEASSVAGTFFDGSTTDALGWDYAWSGTANASISTAASAATTVRTNLSTNPNSETAAIGTAGAGTATVAVSTTQKYSGTQSTKLTWVSGAVGLAPVNGAFTATAGQVYTVSVYVFWESGEAPYLEVQDQSYNNITGVTGVRTPTVMGSWQRLWVTFTVPAGATGFRVYDLVTSASTYYMDAVLLEQSGVLGDYFDGSFNPAGDFSYAWTGTANASTSIQRGATPSGWATQYAGTTISSNAQQYVGSRSIRFDSSLQYGNTVCDSTVTASQTYTASVWVKGEVGKQFYMELEERTSGGAVVGVTYGTVTTATGNWQRVAVTRTFGSTGVTARIRVASNTAVHTMYLDAALVEASPIVQDYFDGSVVSADADLTNSWSGTAHASTSLMRGVGVTGYLARVIGSISSTDWFSSGTKSIRAIPTSSTDTGSRISLEISTTIGSTYTVQAKIRLVAHPSDPTKAQVGTLNSRARTIEVLNSSGTRLVISNAAPNNAGVTTLTATFQANSATTAIHLYNGASAGNGDVWWDDLMVVAGTYTGAYFDGNSTDSGNITYSWTGTPNASTSTMLSEMVLYGNPPRATTYTVTNINQPPTKVCTLVIPPEYTLYLGASGTSTGSAGVFIRPIQASDSLYYGPLEELTLLDPNGSVRMNKTLNGATYQAVEVFLMKTDANVGTVTLNSMMAQLYKTGTTPQLPSEHYQGEGSTGLMFADDAIVETYSYMHPPRKGISTKLIEVEAWR